MTRAQVVCYDAGAMRWNDRSRQTYSRTLSRRLETRSTPQKTAPPLCTRDHAWNGVGSGILKHLAHDLFPSASTIRDAYAASREVMRAVAEQNGQPRLPEENQ